MDATDIDIALRPWVESDFDLLVALLGDPDMMVYLGGSESHEKLTERHTTYLALPPSTGRLYAVEYGSERIAVGWVGYWTDEWQGEQLYEIGWHVLPAYQGRGVASTAASLAIERATFDARHRYMHAAPSLENAASNAVCRKLGFELLGEVDIEFPKGHPMRANDWRLELESPPVDRAQVERLVAEEIEVVGYDPAWPVAFEAEKEHLLSAVPSGIVERIEHFGSTAVPGLSAKPIIDILVEVTDLAEVRERVVPILESQGYEYVWRPTMGEDGPPWYAWFIKRDPETGARTHHIHMVEPSFAGNKDRLLFRDYLIEHPELAEEYAALKTRLAHESADRVEYTQAKSEFVERVTQAARESST